MDNINILVTDEQTRLVLQLPEGAHTIHTNTVERQHGKAVSAMVRKLVNHRGKFTGYRVLSIAHEDGFVQDGLSVKINADVLS